MKTCPECGTTWGDEVRICCTVTDKTRQICGGKLE